MQISEKVDSELFSRNDLIFAYAVRQESYIAAVPPQVIIAALKAAKEVLDAHKFNAWKEAVSSKLDEISAKLDEVLKELRSLRVWIPEALDEETRKMWSSGIDADRHILDGVIAGLKGKPDDKTVKRLDVLLHDVQKTTLSLADWGRYGFSHFNEVVTGTIAVLAAMQLLKLPRTEVSHFVEVMIKYFKSIINLDIKTSIMAARNDSATDVINRDKDLNNLLNRWWTYSRFTDYPRRGEGSVLNTYDYICFSGTPASGISRVDTSSERENCRWPWYPHGTGDSARIDINSRLAQRKQAVANTDKLSVFVNTCEEIKGILESMLHKPKLDESDESDESEVIEDVNDR